MRCSSIGHDIWRCSISPQDVSRFKIKSPFWTDVLYSWSQYNYYCSRRIENQLIWYNSRIKIAGKGVFWKDCYQKGLKYVFQLYDNKKFKPEDVVLVQYGLTRMRYNSLKSALPQDWKDFFEEWETTQFLPIPPHNLDTFMCLEGRKISRTVYSFLAEDVTLIHSKFIKWKLEVGDEMSDTLIDFGKKHLDIFKVTNIPKLRSFQYRILQRGLVTNIQLFKWDIKSSDLCSFCGVEQETYAHLFFHCEKVLPLWQGLTRYILERFGINIQARLDVANVLCNQVMVDKRHVANLLCLLTKYYIYVQQCLNVSLSYNGLKGTFYHFENMEKYIATKNGRLETHLKKWEYKQHKNRNIGCFLQQYMNDM